MPEIKPKVNVKDEDILDSLKPDIDKAKAIQDELATQRADYYKAYRGEPYGNEREGWAQSVSPLIYNSLQWSMPAFMDVFHEEFFMLKSDNEDRAEKLQKLIYYQMYRKQDGFRRAYEFFYDAYLYHYSVFKVCYKEDYDIEYDTYDRLTAEEFIQLLQDTKLNVTKYTESQDIDGRIVYEKVKVARKVINYAGPYMEVIPPWEFFYTPDCKLGDWGNIEGRLIYHEVTRTMNDIRKKEKVGLYREGSYEKVLASFEEGVKSSAHPDSFEVKIGVDEVSEHDTQAPETNELSKEVRIKECYYRLDIDGDGLLEPVIIVMCGDIILQVEENPYNRPPFRVGSISPEPHKITGLAMPKVLENDQKIMTNLLRLIQDSAAQSCYRNPITNDQQLFKMLQDRKPYQPMLGDPNKVGEVKQSSPDQFILKAYELLKAENEEKTSISRYNQGQDASSLNKTATGINIIYNASEKRIRLIIALMGNGVFSGVIRDFIFINQKWPSDDPIKLLGQNIEINKEDLDGEYSVEIDIGTSPSEKQAIANQIDLIIQFATQAGLQLGIIKPEGVMKAIRKKYRVLGVNVNDILVDEKVFIQEQLAKQQQQQMMAKQQALIPPVQGGQGSPQGSPPPAGGLPAAPQQ